MLLVNNVQDVEAPYSPEQPGPMQGTPWVLTESAAIPFPDGHLADFVLIASAGIPVISDLTAATIRAWQAATDTPDLNITVSEE